MTEYGKAVAENIAKIQKSASDNSAQAAKLRKVQYDKQTLNRRFAVGDLVLRKIERITGCRKLQSKFDGPHRVVYTTDSPVVLIRVFDDPNLAYQKVSVMRLKKFTPRPETDMVALCGLSIILSK
jgi:hypothetical protein